MDIFELFKQISKEEKRDPTPVTWIVACLGNIGKEYEMTRHNSGFLFADAYSKENGFKIDRAKFDALVGETTVGKERVLFLCPTTYMNNSGIAVKKAADFYKVPANHILVVYDDISLDVGRIRIRRKGSDGGHNGIKSIIAHLSSSDFPRIKIGVGQKPNPEYDLANWVLGKINEKDLPNFKEALSHASEALNEIIGGNFENAMNRFNQNGKNKAEHD